MLAILAAVCVLATWSPASATADTDPWSAPDPTRGVVYGTLLDDTGKPFPGVYVSAETVVLLPGGGITGWWTQAPTDAAGRYRMPLRERTDDLQATGYRVWSRQPDHVLDPVPQVFPKAGEATRLDLVLRRRSARLSGRVTVRGGAPAAERLRLEVRVAGQPFALSDAVVQPDGRYEIAVPSGTMSINAESRFGLPGEWLGPQPGGGPARNRLLVAPGEVRDGIDLELRARLPYRAYDQYGDLHVGSAPQEDFPVPEPRYPADETPRRGALVGPVARVGAFEMPSWLQGSYPVPWLEVPYGFNRYEVHLDNDGDDDLWIRGVRFEGRDAGLFRCESLGGTYYPLPCAPGQVTGARLGVVRPLATGLALPLTVDQSVHRDVYEATAVIDTNAPDSPHRVPMRVVNRTGERPCTPPSCVVPGQVVAPPAGVPATGTVGRAVVSPPRGPAAIDLTRRRVRAVLPAAGRVTFRVDARGTRGRARVWRTVRRASASAGRAGTVSRRIATIRPGSYRVLVRFTPKKAGRPVAVWGRMRVR